MKLLVPCVLLSVLFACAYSAPGPICVCFRDDCKGFEKVDNGDKLVRVAHSSAGGGDTGEGGTGFTEVDNGDELDVEEDHGARFDLVDNGNELDVEEDHGAVFEEVDNGDELDIEDDQGAAGFEEVYSGDDLVRLVYTPAGGDDYGAYIGGDGTDDGLKYVPEDIDSLSLEIIVGT